MLNRLAREAHSLDDWLRDHVPLYGVILTWGLVVAILGSLRSLGRALGDASDGGGLGDTVTLVFQAALLVSQLAQWHEHREDRRRRREARG
jgi:hypothetical protein